LISLPYTVSNPSPRNTHTVPTHCRDEKAFPKSKTPRCGGDGTSEWPEVSYHQEYEKLKQNIKLLLLLFINMTTNRIGN